MEVTLSEKAVSKVRQILEEKKVDDAVLRIFVKQGGCSGYSYGMALDRPQEDDYLVESDDIRLAIDHDSAPLLEGMMVDYKEALMGGGFTIDNPNATRSCACGSSFRTDRKKGKPEKCTA